MRLCTICARGGSKGLPGKNISDLVGRPLIAWSIAQALESNLFDLVAVSSDSAEILDVAKAAGAHLAIVRPAELATDSAGKIPAIVHAVRAAEGHASHRFETLVDLGATAPLRTPADIIGAVEALERDNRTSVITGSLSRCSPYFSLVELKPDGTVDVAKRPPAEVLRRQDAPLTYDMNGSIYVWSRDRFLADPRVFYPDTVLFEMPDERSIDIDTPLDFEIADFLMRRRLPSS